MFKHQNFQLENCTMSPANKSAVHLDGFLLDENPRTRTKISSENKGVFVPE